MNDCCQLCGINSQYTILNANVSGSKGIPYQSDGNER